MVTTTDQLHCVPDASELELTIETLRRPALDTGVRLVGKLEGGGYAEQQWLAERNGKFVQLSELLYLIAERCDGEHTLAEIASDVSAVSKWALSADDVQHLIHRKLVPLGVIEAPFSAETAPARLETPASPLALNLRARVIGPRLIRPIADALKLFHRPAVMIPLVALALSMHVWLYLVHGLGASATNTLESPGRLLIVLGIVVVAAAFHEFGHASALRYGGGEVRGMGAGIYLIYPIFYTDVTDSYRLSRGERVRTDLGGVYFHLLFALVLIAVATLAHQPFLLLAVVLINLEIARQFIPFVRLDGYWLLADLTGIPDPLSHIGPALARLVRLHRRGPALPALRRRIRAIFAVYAAVTVPVLTALTLVLLMQLPRIMAASWHGLASQIHAIPALASNGQFAALALSLGAVVILAVPFAGLAYVAYCIGRLGFDRARVSLSRLKGRRAQPSPA